METASAPMRFIVAGRAAHCNSCGAEIEGEGCPNGPHAPMRFIVVGSPVQEGARAGAPARADNCRAYCMACGSDVDANGCRACLERASL